MKFAIEELVFIVETFARRGGGKPYRKIYS
jgi:hypothetical protein